MTTTRKERMPGTPSRSVLRLIPERVVVFLHGLATNPEIAAALSGAGYTKRDHLEGAQLLHEVCLVDAEREEFAAHAQRLAAQRELDEWANCHFARLRCGVEHRHPDRLDLFKGIWPLGTTKSSVSAVHKLLQRVKALPDEAGGLRAFLAGRRFDAPEIERLSRLVEVAKSVPSDAGEAREPLVQ
jgi:hypothetical protein